MEKNWTEYFRDVARTVRTDSPDLALIATKSAQASEHLKKIAQLFPPGTGRDVVPGTRAKPEVWTQRADFDAAMTAMIDATTSRSADVVKERLLEKVKTEWPVAAKACGGCHGGPTKAGGKFRFEERIIRLNALRLLGAAARRDRGPDALRRRGHVDGADAIVAPERVEDGVHDRRA